MLTVLYLLEGDLSQSAVAALLFLMLSLLISVHREWLRRRRAKKKSQPSGP